jgi:hypothetical protein
VEKVHLASLDEPKDLLAGSHFNKMIRGERGFAVFILNGRVTEVWIGLLAMHVRIRTALLHAG